MARPKHQFCQLELPFVLSNTDFLELSPEEKTVYFYLWFKSVNDRFEWHKNDAALHRWLSFMTRLSIPKVSLTLKRVQELTAFLPQKGDWFRVRGVKGLHHTLQWFTANKKRIFPDIEEKSIEEYRRGEETRCATSNQNCPPPKELDKLMLYRQDEKLCRRWNEVYPVWVDTYPGIDVIETVRKAHAWEVANPKKRKKDRVRFLNAWLARKQDRPGRGYNRTGASIQEPPSSPRLTTDYREPDPNAS